MSTSKAGPSKVKSKKVAAPEIPALSAETIDSSSDESDNDESSESADSEGDLEDIAPKKKSASRPKTKAGHEGSLPPDSKYAPPAGMIPIDMDTAFIGSAFDYDQLEKNPNLELWSIRVPADFKTSRLASLVIDVRNSRKEVKGSLKHKSTTYSLAQASATNGKSGESKEGDSTVKDTTVEALTGTSSKQLSGGAEEMEGGMRLMIPSSRAGGRLQVAPLPVHRHLILTPDVPELSTAGGLSSEDQVPSSFLSVVGQNPTEMMDVPMEGALPAKRKQPAHLLKFRNRAYGFDTPGPNQPETSPKETTMDVDDEITPKKRKTGESTKKNSKK